MTAVTTKYGFDFWEILSDQKKRRLFETSFK